MPTHTFAYQFVVSGLEQEDADWLMMLVQQWISHNTDGRGRMGGGGGEWRPDPLAVKEAEAAVRAAMVGKGQQEMKI